MIIDTHLHVIDRTRLAYPWLAGTPLDRDFLYETYALEAKRLGIAKALHMEVDVDEARIEDETGYVAELMDRPDSLIVGAISSCRPESEDFSLFLDRQLANPLIRGLRRILHELPDDYSDTDLYRANVGRLAGTRLTYDLCVLARQLDWGILLVDSAPDVRFVLDHCGIPDIRGDAFAFWRDRITEIAKRPNVTAKISGIVAYADAESWSLETLRPWFEHMIGAFGWNRVIWGSDWPVCTLGGGLSTWIGATHALLSGVSADDRQKLLGGNARRLWTL